MNSWFDSRTVSALAVILTILSVGVTCTGDVKFTLYRRGRSERHFTAASSTDFMRRHLDPALPFKFVIHGWLGGGTSEVITSIVHAYLERGGYNLVGVDWSDWADTISYPTAKRGVKEAAGILVRLLGRLFELGVTRPESVHLLGFSLGSHVAGAAGAAFSNRKLARITGLDPAGPLYVGSGREERLDDTDATLVDVIHTCGGVLGYIQPLGHIDFYPNGGRPPQPKCTTFPYYCSHRASYVFYNATISDERVFPAYSAASWQRFLERGCKPEGQQPVYMGHIADRFSALGGVYFLATETSACSS